MTNGETKGEQSSRTIRETSGRRRRQAGTASQTALVWRDFRRHRLAVVGAGVMVVVIFVMLFAEFLAPFSTTVRDEEYPYAPPQQLHIVDRSSGDWDWGLYVHDFTWEQDADYRIHYLPDESTKIEVGLFVRGHEYDLFGLIPTDRHLIGPVDPDASMYLLGADQSGRDQLSQLIYATRVSMSVGLIGVAVAFILGVVLGGISGYFGGRTDTVIQRFVEIAMAVPALPLWLGLTAAMPADIDPVHRYLLISALLSMLAWTGLAREVRGRFLMLREEAFVTSAWLDGASRRSVMFRHMLPSFTSHLIAALTLSIPGMILAETALSWLGLGLRRPVVSWGVLMDAATSGRVILQAPWLLLPGLIVVVVVLSLNFIGDGLRDSADPYRT